jgi:hypothetical protein
MLPGHSDKRLHRGCGFGSARDRSGFRGFLRRRQEQSLTSRFDPCHIAWTFPACVTQKTAGFRRCLARACSTLLRLYSPKESFLDKTGDWARSNSSNSAKIQLQAFSLTLLFSLHEHAIAVGIETISLAHGMFVSLQCALPTGKRRHQHQQRRLRQVEVG